MIRKACNVEQLKFGSHWSAALLTTGNGKLWVVAVYLSPSLSAAEVTVNIKEIVELLMTSQTHYIVGGDFNMEWNTLLGKLNEVGLRGDIYRHSTGKTRMGFSGVNSQGSEIDHLFASLEHGREDPGVDLKAFDYTLSDHRPIWADIEIEEIAKPTKVPSEDFNKVREESLMRGEPMGLTEQLEKARTQAIPFEKRYDATIFESSQTKKDKARSRDADLILLQGK